MKTYPDRLVFVVLGHVPSWKNLFGIRKGGKGLYRNEDYTDSFLFQVPARYRLGIDWPVVLWVLWYPRDMRRDLELEAIPDLLQKAGVIKNDRQVIEKHLYRAPCDKENPKVVIVLERMDSTEPEQTFYRETGVSK